MNVAEAVAGIRRRMALACALCGRAESSVALLAATKTRGYAEIRAAAAAGVDAAGENRVGELLEKYPLGAYDGLPLHFIGTLQTNKAKYIVGKADLIHSLDSERLIALVSRLALGAGIRQDALIEVNIAGEASKSGAAVEDIPALAAAAAGADGINLRGITAIPPAGADPEPYFERAAELFQRVKKDMPEGFDTLSMGMTADFEKAIAFGSTIVRIGSGIFGERLYR